MTNDAKGTGGARRLVGAVAFVLALGGCASYSGYSLKAGVATVRLADGKILYFAVDGGVLGVQKNGVRLLTGRVAAADTPEKAQTALAGLNRKR